MSEIVIEKKGYLGLITLNRPKAMNALNTQMCVEITNALNDFAQDDTIHHVAIHTDENANSFALAEILNHSMLKYQRVFMKMQKISSQQNIN